MQNRALSPSVVLALYAGILLGCARSAPRMDQPAIDRLSILGEAYLQATQRLNRGPRNLDELKAQIAPPHELTDLLTSPHDGQLYVIVWNIDPRKPPVTEIPPLIAYEQAGRDGKYDVLTTMGIVRINRQELDKYIAATPGARAP